MKAITNIEFNDIKYHNQFEFVEIVSKYHINNASLKRIIGKIHQKVELTDIEKKAVVFIQAHCVCHYANDWEQIQIQEFARLLGVKTNYIETIIKLFYNELSTA